MNDSIANPALDGCVVSLRRCLVVLDCLSPEQFSTEVNEYGTIGVHLRHALDHFTAFFRGLDSGRADYDDRDRDKVIEQNLQECRNTTEGVIRTLENLDKERIASPITIRQLANIGTDAMSLNSTVERELLFLSGHTIHHLAIILLIATLLEIDVPLKLGLAFSTEAHRDSTARFNTPDSPHKRNP